MYKVRKRRGTRIKKSRNLAQATEYIVMFHDGRGQSRQSSYKGGGKG